MKIPTLCGVVMTLMTCGGYALAEPIADQTDKPRHHTKTGYTNPYLTGNHKSAFSFLKMRLFGEEEWADYDANKEKVPTQPANLVLIQNPGEHLQVTWIGHATFLIQYRGINIITDPIFSDYASPFSFAGPKRVHPPALQIEALPKIDWVIISHNHYDHLDLGTVQQLGNRTRWMVPLGHKEWFKNAGVTEAQVRELDWWDFETKGKVKITATPSQHWSGRGLWDRFECLWASWIIQIDDLYIWFGGDTGYNPYQFKEIGSAFPDLDLALIPIGSYEPRWFMKEMHVNPEEAVKIHQDLGVKYSIGMHWGTFPLTSEPIEEPPQKLMKALVDSNLPVSQFETLKIGETRMITATKNDIK